MKKIYIFITLIVVIILAIIFNQFNKEQLPPHAEVNTTTEIDITNVEKYEELTFPDNNLDTSDWETYKTTNFQDYIAFEIMLPQEWSILTFGEKQAGPTASMVIYDERTAHGSDNGIYMEVLQQSFNDHLSQQKSQSAYTKITVNNTYGYILTERANFIADSIVIENSAKDRIYIFYIIGKDEPSNPGEYLPVLEQILLSFKLQH